MGSKRDANAVDSICKTCLSNCFFLHKNADTFCPFSGSCDSCKAFTALGAEIADLEARLAKVSQQRQDLKTRMNSDHDRLIHRFPFEITCEIFNYVVEDGDDEGIRRNLGNPVLRLGGVCKRWRGITLNIPELWSRVTIALWRYSSPDFLESLDVLEEWSRRSSPSPLSVTIKSQKNPLAVLDSRDAIQGLERVLTFLKSLPSSGRWGGLSFYGPSSVMLALLNGLEYAPTLDVLQITLPPEGYWSPRAVTPSSMQGEFNPTSLVVSAASLLKLVPLSWERLTRINVSNISINELLHIVRVAINLRTLQLTSITRFNNQPEFPMPTQPIVNRSLRQLNTQESQYVGILRHLTLPALSQLEHCFYRSGMDYLVFPAFVGRSGLRSLTNFSIVYQLDELSYPQSNEECQYDNMPAVTHLHIEIPPSRFKTRQNILGIGERLLSPLTPSGAFSRLQEMTITAPILSSASWSYLCTFLVDDRRPLKQISIRLTGEESLSKPDVMISEIDCAQLVQVKNSGINVSLFAEELGEQALDLLVLHDFGRALGGPGQV